MSVLSMEIVLAVMYVHYMTWPPVAPVGLDCWTLPQYMDACVLYCRQIAMLRSVVSAGATI